MRTVISACILWIFLVAGFAAATTYLVKPDGTGDFPTIQAAMDAAAPGDTVDLDDGTFAGPGNRDLSYEGKAILVRPRNGNAADCIIDCGGWGTEPRRDFSTETEGPGSILEAVTITGGCLSQPDVLGDIRARPPPVRFPPEQRLSGRRSALWWGVDTLPSGGGFALFGDGELAVRPDRGLGAWVLAGGDIGIDCGGGNARPGLRQTEPVLHGTTVEYRVPEGLDRAVIAARRRPRCLPEGPSASRAASNPGVGRGRPVLPPAA